MLSKNFKYPLDVLLKQHQWEIEALKIELARVNQVLDARISELHTLSKAAADTQQAIMNMYRNNQIISLDKKKIADLFLHQQHQLMIDKEQEIGQVRSLAEQIFTQLSKKKQSQRVIEKHRERKCKDFEAEKNRSEAIVADELWLARSVRLKG